MRLADLRAAIQREWEQSGALESDGYIASGLMSWERDFYLRFLKPAGRVLVIGCGTGRDLLALPELGYRAEGLDVAPQCTATAGRLLQKLGFQTPLYTGAIEDDRVARRDPRFVIVDLALKGKREGASIFTVLSAGRERVNALAEVGSRSSERSRMGGKALRAPIIPHSRGQHTTCRQVDLIDLPRVGPHEHLVAGLGAHVPYDGAAI